MLSCHFWVSVVGNIHYLLHFLTSRAFFSFLGWRPVELQCLTLFLAKSEACRQLQLGQIDPYCYDQLIFNLLVNSGLVLPFQPTGSDCSGKKFGTEMLLKASIEQRVRLCSHNLWRHWRETQS